MPIGRRGWRWFWPRFRSGSTGSKVAFGALLVCAAWVYAFLGLVVFDAAYWVLGKIARAQADRRIRVGLSVAFVAVYLIGISIAAASSPQANGPGASATPLVANANSTASAVPSASTADSSPSPTLGAPADTPTGAPTATDGDDTGSGVAGGSFAPNATGVLPPAAGGGAADRLSGEPDPSLTPGALNPAVTQATIGFTICVSGWTATIRPDTAFTDALKVKQIGQYGYTDTSTASYEEDHLISLELGCAPADAVTSGRSRTLWRCPTVDPPVPTSRTALRPSSRTRSVLARSPLPRPRVR